MMTRKEKRAMKLEQRKLFREATAAGERSYEFFWDMLQHLPLMIRVGRAFKLIWGKR